MKTLTVGDLHGKRDWESIDPSLYDKIIFVGDYCDSFDHSDTEITSNLLNLIEFKRDNMDKIELLIGNHDASYMDTTGTFRCSGYRPDMFLVLNDIFEKNKTLFKIAHQEKNYLWTHAGVSDWWYNRNIDRVHKLLSLDDNLADILNKMWNSRYQPFFAEVGFLRGGTCKSGSPIWCHLTELINDPIPNFNQIVGHNRLDRVSPDEFYKVEHKNGDLYFVDILDTRSNYFLELEI